MYRSIGDKDYQFAELIWENEPIHSRELAALAQEKLGWKPSTSYTVLKKLCDRLLFENKQAVVTSLVAKDEIIKNELNLFIKKVFDGSLVSLVSSLTGASKLTEEEADILRRLIDESEAD